MEEEEEEERCLTACYTSRPPSATGRSATGASRAVVAAPLPEKGAGLAFILPVHAEGLILSPIL